MEVSQRCSWVSDQRQEAMVSLTTKRSYGGIPNAKKNRKTGNIVLLNGPQYNQTYVFVGIWKTQNTGTTLFLHILSHALF